MLVLKDQQSKTLPTRQKQSFGALARRAGTIQICPEYKYSSHPGPGTILLYDVLADSAVKRREAQECVQCLRANIHTSA